MKSWRADLALVAITAIWGSTFIVVKGALDAVGPLTFVAARFWIAWPTLLLLLLVRRTPITRATLIDGGITGVFLALGFITQTVGLQTTDAGKTAFITGLYVVMVPILSAALLRQPPTWAALTGILLATAGLGLITLNQELRLEPGDLWVMVCAVAFALQIIATARYALRHPATSFAMVQLGTTALLALLVAALFESPLRMPPAAAWPAILYVGLGATGIVFVIQTWAQRHTTPTHAALIFSLEPVFAALLALTLGGETLTEREWAGGGLILVGMIIAELGSLMRWRRRRRVETAD